MFVHVLFLGYMMHYYSPCTFFSVTSMRLFMFSSGTFKSRSGLVSVTELRPQEGNRFSGPKNGAPNNVVVLSLGQHSKRGRV